MSKPIWAIVLILFAFAVLAPCRTARAGEPGAEAQKNFERKSEINRVFLEAARKIAEESGSSNAISYVNKAAFIAEEAALHWDAGEPEFAIEDIAESNRFATYAIIFAKAGNGPIKDLIVKEELRLWSEEEHERKEARIRKGLPEVETFINTGERLLSEVDHPEAREKLEEAKKKLASSKALLASGNYDGALSHIKAAYTLATGSVKDIKHSEGEIITFPRADFESEEETFIHELKRNNAYLFFATTVVEKDDREAASLLKKASALKDEALAERAKDNFTAAIEKLTGSTDILVETIKTATK